MSPISEKSAGSAWLAQQKRKVEAHEEVGDPERLVAASVEVEAWLRKHQVEYAPVTSIPMGMIDDKKSRQNQARRDALVVESVDRFTTALKAGAQFPPIVVYQLGEKLVIVDGNNRHAAAQRAKLETIRGFVISGETPSEIIQLLTVQANASHGVTPDVGWRLQQAFHLISIGIPDAESADAAAVTLQQLRTARAIQEADNRARLHRIFGFGDLPTGTRSALNVIKDDLVFVAAARLCAGMKPSNEQVRELLRRIKAVRSEAERLTVIAEMAKEFAVDTATKKAMSRGVSAPKQALVAGIGLVLKCDPAALVTQILTPHDRDVVNTRLRELVDKILEIQIALDPLKNMEDR